MYQTTMQSFADNNLKTQLIFGYQKMEYDAQDHTVNKKILKNAISEKMLIQTKNPI